MEKGEAPKMYLKTRTSIPASWSDRLHVLSFIFNATIRSRSFLLVTSTVLLLIFITAGILVVCFTSKTPEKQKCVPKLVSQNQDWHGTKIQKQPIVIFDVNNDHHLDVIVAQQEKSGIDIFIGDGSGTLPKQPSISFPTVSPIYSIVANDLNNDRLLDLVVAHYNEHSIGVLFGDDNGSFTTEQLFSTGISRPVSLLINDFNNDKLFDIVVANQDTDSLGLYFGKNNQSFHTPKLLSTGFDSAPYGLVSGDLNSDGQPDIIVTNVHTNNIGIFLGYGNGSFSKQKIYSTGQHPSAAAIGNFNNDPHTDIVVSNSDSNNLYIFLGQGNGTLKVHGTYSTGIGSQPSAVIVDDFNRDKISDIIAVNSGMNNIGLFLGKGDGTFKEQRIYTIYVGAPQLIASGDLNEDDWMDVIVTINSARNVGVFLGGESENFTEMSSYSAGPQSGPCSIALGDINNDKFLDIVEVNERIGNIGIYLGHGDGKFDLKIPIAIGSGSKPVFVVVSDLNLDGNLDIITANSGTNNLAIFLGNGDTTFSNTIFVNTTSNSKPYSIAVGDFDNNNLPDIIVANSGLNNIMIFQNFRNSTFTDQSSYFTPLNSHPVSVATGHFNNDTWLDIVVAYDSNQVGILLGNASGGFSNKALYATDNRPWSVVIGNFNNDTFLDVAIANYDSGTVCVFSGNGDGTLSQKRSYATGVQPKWMTVGDVNDDDRLDLVVPNFDADTVSVLFGNGDGNFSNKITYYLGFDSLPSAVALGDFNGDNHLDVVVSLYYFYVIAVFLGYFNSPFTSPMFYSSNLLFTPFSVASIDFNNENKWSAISTSEAEATILIYSNLVDERFQKIDSYFIADKYGFTSLALADFNNDSKIDIVLTSPMSDSISFLMTHQNGTFKNAISYDVAVGSAPSSVSTGDFNHDSHPDIVTVNHDDSTISVFLHYGFGSFLAAKRWMTGSGKGSRAMDFGDFNKDNLTDIVSVNGQNQTITIFLGDGRGGFFNSTLYSTTDSSWPFGVTVTDFDNDSNLDIAVVFKFSNELAIFFGDGNGTFPNELKYSFSIPIYPVYITAGDLDHNGYQDLVFVSYNGYGIIVLLGFGNERTPIVYSYSTGSSSVLWGVAISDFNNDNNSDVVAVDQNGAKLILLIGDGHGNFTKLKRFSTGNDSRPLGLAVSDLDDDHRMDVVVANYGADSVSIFRGLGNGTFLNPEIYSTGHDSSPYDVRIGDFNRDGQLDIAVALSLEDSIAILFAQADKRFSAPVIFSVGKVTYPWFLAVFDINGDGWLDVAATLANVEGIALLLGDPDRVFLAPLKQYVGTKSAPQAIAVADFNHDTYLDIAVTLSQSDSISILFGLGDGHFSNQTTYSTGDKSLPWSISTGDFNNDTQLDLVVTNVKDDSFAIFLGKVDGTFENLIRYSTGQLTAPVSVVVFDFNKDKRLDIAVANKIGNSLTIFQGIGDGTFVFLAEFPTGYNSHPNSLAVGDFTGDGWTDIVVTTPDVKNQKLLLRVC